jgi:endonuclease/exonuclease/phosphatase family metal-dependent hydrolase
MMELKIVCLNLWEGGNLIDAILDYLAKENADVLMLQEVYSATDSSLPRNYRSIQVLQEKLNYPFYDFAPAMLDIMPEAKVLGGNAVFSKFPLIAHEPVFFNEPLGERHPKETSEFPTTPRNLQHVTITLPDNELNVFNFQGVWDLDGDNYSPQRKQMSDVIINAIKDTPNVVLGGDTNAKPTNKAMTDIEDHLHSVFGNELTTSFNMKHKINPGYATAVVDMLFVSQNIIVQDHYCPDVDVSDHLPLVAKLKLQ